MQTILYDGSFDGLLCAVFDAYEYRFTDAEICTEEQFNGNLFAEAHHARMDPQHSKRVWKGLEGKLSKGGLDSVYYAFLSEDAGIANVLLRYIRYCFASSVNIEKDYSHEAVLTVTQTARKVGREKHRMEAFVRFQKTADDLYYSVIEPDHDVLPLIRRHFEKRYADQRWMIYDSRRQYGIYYDGNECSEVTVAFAEQAQGGQDISPLFDEKEAIYQKLWQQYFKSTNIQARKNTRLHLQHMPRRYWKYLTEKRGL